MSEPELSRGILGRRRRSLWLGAAALVAAQVATVAAVMCRDAPRVTYVTHTTSATTLAPAIAIPVPLLVMAPAPAPSALVQRGACPPERRDAPMLAVPTLPEDITAVQPAPSNAGWIAAWNDHHVYASTDAGASFARVLDGPGKVGSVTFDCFGRVLVVRDDRIGVRDGETEVWRPIRGASLAQLLGGGPDIVAVGTVPDEEWTGRVAISSDAGATWRFRDLHVEYSGDHVRGRQLADATIQIGVQLADCRNDILHWISARGATVLADESDSMPEGSSFGVYGDVAVNGWQWRKRGGEWQDLRGLPAADPEDRIVVDGPWPVLIAGGVAYRITAGIARRLPWTLRGVPQAVDLAGRLWAVADGQPALVR